MSPFVVEIVPKIVVGLLVPLGQYSWKYVQDHSHERRKSHLRTQVAELNAQRDALTRLPETLATNAALTDLDGEISSALNELASLVAVKRAAQEPRESRGFFSRWLLLYAPSGVGGWCLHVSFFVMLSIAIFGAIGFASDWTGDSDDIDGLIGLGAALLIAFGLAALADQLDRKRRIGDTATGFPRSRWVSFFLLYAPSGVAAWCLHILFFFLIATVVFGSLGVASDWNTDPERSDAILGFAIMAVIALVCRALARKLDRDAPRPAARSLSQDPLT
jgi:hypothetical protein